MKTLKPYALQPQLNVTKKPAFETTVTSGRKTSIGQPVMAVQDEVVGQSGSQNFTSPSQKNIFTARPDAPKLPSKVNGPETRLEYTVMTIVYGDKEPNLFAVKMAEITADEWDVVAIVKRENGQVVVEFDPDFNPSAFNISENGLNDTIKQATEEL